MSYKFFLSFTFTLFLALFVHESGHGITVEILGGKFRAFYIFPGFEIWPEFGQSFPGNWNGLVAKVDYAFLESWGTNSWQIGLVLLMGSGLNLFASILALTTLWIIRPNGWLMYFLIAESLMFLDILLYTFLPQLHLKHFVFIGGNFPEPLLGALMLGFSETGFMIFITTISICISFILVVFVNQNSRKKIN